MGCDIHLHQEVKINGAWHHYAALDYGIERDYKLFGKMANVRMRTTPIIAPRGIPDDETFLTKFNFAKWGPDAHTPSWFGIDEIDALHDWMRENSDSFPRYVADFTAVFGYCFGGHWTDLKHFPEDVPEGLEDVRWIFWFDN